MVPIITQNPFPMTLLSLLIKARLLRPSVLLISEQTEYQCRSGRIPLRSNFGVQCPGGLDIRRLAGAKSSSIAAAYSYLTSVRDLSFARLSWRFSNIPLCHDVVFGRLRHGISIHQSSSRQFLQSPSPTQAQKSVHDQIIS